MGGYVEPACKDISDSPERGSGYQVSRVTPDLGAWGIDATDILHAGGARVGPAARGRWGQPAALITTASRRACASCSRASVGRFSRQCDVTRARAGHAHIGHFRHDVCLYYHKNAEVLVGKARSGISPSKLGEQPPHTSV